MIYPRKLNPGLYLYELCVELQHKAAISIKAGLSNEMILVMNPVDIQFYLADCPTRPGNSIYCFQTPLGIITIRRSRNIPLGHVALVHPSNYEELKWILSGKAETKAHFDKLLSEKEDVKYDDGGHP